MNRFPSLGQLVGGQRLRCLTFFVISLVSMVSMALTLSACDLFPTQNTPNVRPTATSLGTVASIIIEDGNATLQPGTRVALPSIRTYTASPTSTVSPTITPGTPLPTATSTITLTPFATPTRFTTPTVIQAPPTVTPRLSSSPTPTITLTFIPAPTTTITPTPTPLEVFSTVPPTPEEPPTPTETAGTTP